MDKTHAHTLRQREQGSLSPLDIMYQAYVRLLQAASLQSEI